MFRDKDVFSAPKLTASVRSSFRATVVKIFEKLG